MSVAQASRNAPCPCGSGQRYKDCHGALGGPPATPATATTASATAATAASAVAPDAGSAVPTLLLRAQDELARGAASTAEATWREVLTVDAHDAEANFHLGNRAREGGAIALAIDHYQRALQRLPQHAGLRNNLGLAFEASGDLAAAEAAYRQVLATDPNHSDALANLGNLQVMAGQFREAVGSFDRALRARRDFPAQFWTQRSVALFKTADFPAAEQSLREALRFRPDDVRLQTEIGALALL